MMSSEQTIAVFGATGRSGKAFVPAALEAGYNVKVMVRSPDKLDDTWKTNKKLTVIQGEFSNREALQKTVEGATYVVSMAGGPMGKPKEYPKDLMLNFVKDLVAIFKMTSTIKVFLFQAGAGSATPDGYLPFIMKILNLVATWIVGIKPNILDNEAVIRYIDSIQDEISFNTIVTRPGAINEKEGGTKLVASESPALSSTSAKDLATFTLEAIKDESLYGKYPFVGKV